MRHFASTRVPAARPEDLAPDGPVSAIERVGCWSVRHRKAAVLGWLAFVAAAFVCGQFLTAPAVQQYDPGQAGQAERMLASLHVVSPPAESVLIQASGRAAPGHAVSAQVSQAAGAVTRSLSALPRAASHISAPVPAPGRDAELVTFRVAGPVGRADTTVTDDLAAVARVQAA